ncbi:hypothetical protein XELAEV_18040579mg [Xenopus laevis]|uniref:CCHC-type domain-containing protein n=1 Tax=Xenopus laevis TaxID=8355 RepID=A0A974C9X7_XENLA|nr:hypothetical protein XELAEV_18040579mg [Xenopus laevis]
MHKGMEIQTVPLISSEVNIELPVIHVNVQEDKHVSVKKTDFKSNVQSDLNICQSASQQCVTVECEQQKVQRCKTKQTVSPLCELESGADINSPVCVLPSQPVCQESGATGAAARLCTQAPTSSHHGAAGATKVPSGKERRSKVSSIAPVPHGSECNSPGVSPGTSIVHNTSKGAAFKGAEQKRASIKGKVKETITAEKVAEALKELATLQNRKKSLEISIKHLTNAMVFSDDRFKESNKCKRDELGNELAGIELRISELYKDVGPWKEVYQNKQRFSAMASSVRTPAAKPALGKSFQTSTSNSPASSESEAEFIKPLPPRLQRRRDKINWQNMAFDQQDADAQEKKQKEEKAFKATVGKKDQAFELSSDQDFPDLPKVKGKVTANPVPKNTSGSGKEEQGSAQDPAGTVSVEEEELHPEEMDIAPTKSASSSVKESERVESGVIEENEVGTSVAVGNDSVSEAVTGVGGMEAECGGVQAGGVAGNVAFSAANVLTEVIQGQVDQGLPEAVEVVSVQACGQGEQVNPASFWERRRLFPVPDLSDNDPFKRKNWVKLKWDGNKEDAPSRRYFVHTMLLDGMGFSSDDLSAVIGQTAIDYDITFKLPEALDHFWRIYNLQKRAGHQNWENLVVIPMTKPETKLITIVMKNDAVPQEDILVWLQRQCTVLSPLVKVYDEDNVWGGVWRTKVRLEVTGNVPNHLPNAFFIGKEKGSCFYVGQPRKCFKCGARDHLAKACAILKCVLCNAVGHEANSCDQVRCNLCNRMGHSHRRCPEAYHNMVRLFPEIDREMRKVMEPVEEKGEQEQEEEVPATQEKVIPKQQRFRQPTNDQKKGKQQPTNDQKKGKQQPTKDQKKGKQQPTKDQKKGKQQPTKDQKKGKQPEKAARGSEVEVPNDGNEKDGWEKVKNKKSKKYAHQLDPGEGLSGTNTFSLSTGNKFSVLDNHSETWGDRAEREEKEELERIEMAEAGERNPRELEEEDMEVQLASKKRTREGGEHPVSKKGVRETANSPQTPASNPVSENEEQ